MKLNVYLYIYIYIYIYIYLDKFHRNIEKYNSKAKQTKEKWNNNNDALIHRCNEIIQTSMPSIRFMQK